MTLNRFLVAASVAVAAPILVLAATVLVLAIAVLVLALPVGEGVKVDVGSPPVLGCESLAHQILAGADVVKKRSGSRCYDGLGVPRNLERVVIAAGFRIVDCNR